MEQVTLDRAEGRKIFLKGRLERSIRQAQTCLCLKAAWWKLRPHCRQLAKHQLFLWSSRPVTVLSLAFHFAFLSAGQDEPHGQPRIDVKSKGQNITGCVPAYCNFKRV